MFHSRKRLGYSKTRPRKYSGKVSKKAVGFIDLPRVGGAAYKGRSPASLNKYQKDIVKDEFRKISSKAEKAALLVELASENAIDISLVENHSVELPKVAPALWKQRSDKSVDPQAFIAETYEAWLGKGLTQSYLHHLDEPLYNALYYWMRTHTLSIDLPTKKVVNDRALQKLVESKPDDPISLLLTKKSRDRQRLYSAAVRRLV